MLADAAIAKVKIEQVGIGLGRKAREIMFRYSATVAAASIANPTLPTSPSFDAGFRLLARSPGRTDRPQRAVEP